MAFRHGQCKGETKKGKCKVGAMDPLNELCGPHREQALRKAKKAFEDLDKPEATGFAQLAEDMLEGEIEVDLPFLRESYRSIR